MTRDAGQDQTGARRPVSRRSALLGGLSVAGLGVASAAMFATTPPTVQAASDPSIEPRQTVDDAIVDFYGEHQAGIATPAQDRLVFAAFDFKGADEDTLRELLRLWTEAMYTMTQGQPVPSQTGAALNAQAPPIDTGEAAGLGPSRLTMTLGFGPSLFDDRLGLAARRPDALVEIPPFPGDRLLPPLCGGDLGVQACADDPQVAFHAVRNLARISRGVATIRWLQLGFGRTSTTSVSQATPRNLMGFKDGTNNLRREDTAGFSSHVWLGGDTDQGWMRGGSYLVTRRIRMRIESWDRASLREQEQIIGRRKTTGAPLNGQREFDAADLSATGADGAPAIPLKAHVRLAAQSPSAAFLLRRGYSFTDGIDATTGELDAGLFFISYQRDPRTGFIAFQQKLSTDDALNEYIRHTGSAIFACPGGIQPGDIIGGGLFSDTSG
jgi:deferrochelatase/peroxidase EfeB